MRISKHVISSMLYRALPKITPFCILATPKIKRKFSENRCHSLLLDSTSCQRKKQSLNNDNF